MRVLVDARIVPGTVGGVEEVIKGLASGLAETGALDQITFLTMEMQDDGWLGEALGAASVAHARRASKSFRMAADALRRRSLDRLPGLRRLPVFGSPIPVGSALVAGPRPDVVHFLTQQGFSTKAPSLYTPHDLLHLHHPEFFAPSEIARRERLYRTLCRQARLVVAMTAWTRDDLVKSYGLEAERVRVIPWGASLDTSRVTPEDEVQRRYCLAGPFVLYPAHTWPHKNHLRLLEALAVLHYAHGLTVPLVCTGHLDSHAGTIREAAERLGLGGQVRFLGRVSEADLRALYGLARALVFPSLFEGWGLPVFDAFVAGLPVASSTATSLPDQTRGAAVLFDPLDVDAMALAVARVWEDENLRVQLVSAGRERVRTLTWRRTARAHLALYREVAGVPLDDLDRRFISASRNDSVEQVPL